MEDNNMIYADGLCYSYEEHSLDDENQNTSLETTALSDLHIEVKKGDFVVIAGRNGSGKSTLARHIGALLSPSGGTLWVNGLDALKEENITEVRRSVGSIFQNPDNQLVASVVEEDVAFGPQNLNVDHDELVKRVEDALQAVGMTSYSRYNPSHLSGGQKQRVAIAGVLAMKSTCIVLDEPTAMLDPEGRKEVLKTLHRLNQEEGITILHITHHMDEALDADYVYVMADGKVALQGTPQEVFTQSETIVSLGLKLPIVTELGEKLLGQKGILRADELEDKLCRLL